MEERYRSVAYYVQKSSQKEAGTCSFLTMIVRACDAIREVSVAEVGSDNGREEIIQKLD